MNVQRLFEVSNKFIDNENIKTVRNLANNIANHLKKLAASPNDNAVREMYLNSRGELDNAIHACVIDQTFSPTDRTILHRLGVLKFTGEFVNLEINEIFSKFSIGEPFVTEGLSKFASEYDKKRQAVGAIVRSFREIGLAETGSRRNAHAELGICIPKARYGNELTGLKDVLSNWDRHLRIIAEVVTGKCEPFKINIVTTSDFTIYLETGVHVAAYVSAFISFSIASIKGVLDISKQIKDLKKSDIPESAFKELEDHCNSQFDKIVDEISNRLLEETWLKDQHRINELSGPAESAIAFILKEIREGVVLEVNLLNGKTEKKDSEKESQNPESKMVQDIIENGHPMNSIGNLDLSCLKITLKNEQGSGKKQSRSKTKPEGEAENMG